ncbi:phage tail tape measure protein [Pseudonocardia sp. WMMC193]|uniref:phage tail tape measure protein n=1 Tax=Pseudonocardia sp. WMMC193 TaxID=2911965 RepID=UPI001F3E1E25|nr:phage tail tape measure protein [Pseudonocardia sp. WMMC193]MCF7550967.1 phage tail tape measure protein [Pseudonocardia sp. WMMC193]
MTTAAAVWVDVLPSMKNFGGDLVRQVSESAGKAGDQAGDEMGERTKSGFSAHVGKIAAVGAVVGTALIGALSASMDASSANAKLAAQLGLNAPEAQRYGKLAGDLYSQAYGESLTQVNDALGAVRQNIGGMATASDADIRNVTKSVLDLSEGLGLDVTESTRAVGTMMRTGMAPDAKSAMDIIVSGMQNGVNVADDLLDTFNEYSTQFRSLGLDGATATGLLSQGLKGGARDADVVADALKEFNLIATSGTKESAAGFQKLGLDANKVSKQIAGGGPGAAAGLDMVLDRLRAMPPGIDRTQTAVALFGTKAEDLGDALYSLDPSSAVSALGEVAGASDRFGTTLNDTASNKIETFKRSLETGVTNFVGNVLIPGLSTAANFVSSVFGPVWSTVGPVIAPIAPHLVAAGAGLGALVLAGKGLGAVKTGLTDARDMVVGVKDAVTGVPDKVRQLGSAWDTVKSGASTAGSAIQTAGSWVADTGRKSVDAAKNLGSLALNYGRAGVAAMVSGARQVGAAVATGVVTAATWAWSAAQAALNFVMSLSPMTWLIIGIVALVAAVIYAWHNFAWFREGVAAAWSGIQTAASWAWGVLQSIFALLGAGTRAVGGFFVWLWQSAVVPAWSGIQAAASWAWGLVSSIFAWYVSGLQNVGSFFVWLWQSAVVPAWSAIQSASSTAWSIVDGVFRFFRDGVDAVGRAFESVAGWIGRSWDSVKEAARTPVQWVVDVVYNNGIRALWNGVARTFGLGELPEVHMKDGGVMPGYTPGRDVHRFFSPTAGWLNLSGGEGFLVPEAVRGLGAGFVGWANRFFSGGRSSGGVGTGGAESSFADGGIWGSIVNAAKGLPGIGALITATDAASLGANIATGGDLRKVLQPAVDSLAGNVGSGAWAQMLRSMIDKTVDAMAKKVDESVPQSYGGPGGGGGAAAPAQVVGWIMQALGFTGTPVSWLGPLQTLIMRESGGNPRAINLWDSNAAKGTPSMGLMQTIGPTFASNRDPRLPNDPYNPLANIVAGINYIKRRYGSVFNVQQAVGATPKGYDSGGLLPTGWSSVYNGTGRPEAVLTGAQWNALTANVRGSDDGGEFVLTSGALEILDDGLVRIVDGRIVRVLTDSNNGRRP